MEKNVSFIEGIVYIGGIKYEKNELLNYLRQMKKVFEVGEQVAEASQRRLKDLLVIADPDRAQVWQDPRTIIKVVESGTSSTGTTYTKFMGYLDGEEQKISINKLVAEIYESDADKHKKQVKLYARTLIQEQIEEFKRGLNKIEKCWLTEAEINIETDEFNVDHVEPFWKLFYRWCNEYGTRDHLIELDERGAWACQTTAEAWQQFHRKKARLAVATARANKQRGGREYGAEGF